MLICGGFCISAGVWWHEGYVALVLRLTPVAGAWSKTRLSTSKAQQTHHFWIHVLFHPQFPKHFLLFVQHIHLLILSLFSSERFRSSLLLIAVLFIPKLFIQRLTILPLLVNLFDSFVYQIPRVALLELFLPLQALHRASRAHIGFGGLYARNPDRINTVTVVPLPAKRIRMPVVMDGVSRGASHLDLYLRYLKVLGFRDGWRSVSRFNKFS